jgi:hypothetical protein
MTCWDTKGTFGGTKNLAGAREDLKGQLKILRKSIPLKKIEIKWLGEKIDE